MNNADLYNVLGLNKDCSADDIKKAYRKLALKYHPDRQQGKSDAEKKEAERKMAEVNSAYAILSNPEKRSQYDSGAMDMNGNSSGFDPFGQGFDPFANMRDDFGFGHRQSKQSGDVIQIQVPIDITDILVGCIKHVKFTRKVRCHTCNGAGGTGKMTCPYCHGTGMVTESSRRGNMVMQRTTVCPHCGGVGYKIEHICKDCGGTGFVEEHKELKIKFPKYIAEGQMQRVAGAGNESKQPGGDNGDFFAIPVYSYDKSRYDLTAFPDVHEKLYVDWVDAVLGIDIDVTIPGDTHTTKITIPECTSDGGEIRLNRRGGVAHEVRQTMFGSVPTGNTIYGDYIYDISYMMPDHLSKEQKELLIKIKEMN